MVHIQLSYTNIAHPILKNMYPMSNTIIENLTSIQYICYICMVAYAFIASGLSSHIIHINTSITSNIVNNEYIQIGMYCIVMSLNILKWLYTMERTYRTISLLALPPLRMTYNKIYNHVRDEKYLIGKELQNSTQV